MLIKNALLIYFVEKCLLKTITLKAIAQSILGQRQVRGGS